MADGYGSTGASELRVQSENKYGSGAPEFGRTPTELKVQASSTTVTVQPRSRAVFDLPRDREKLNAERLRENEELLLGLSADLRINGPDSARLANSTQQFFHDMLQTLEQTSSRAIARRFSIESGQMEEEYNRSLARAFHQHLTKVLMSQPLQLMRSPSTNTLLSDFNTVEGLLAHGVEPYIAAVRKLLRTTIRETQVDVALHQYNFSALDTSLAEGADELQARRQQTVGGYVIQLFCGLCLCAGSVLNRLRKGRAARVDQMEEPLLGAPSKAVNGYVQILKDVTCLVKPGRLTLVLGPPGSGKTSLLKAMSGQLLRTPNKTITTGELTYNGQPVSTLKHLPNWVAYASQNDDHMPLLTVRETLTHAFKCRKEIRFTDEKLKEKVRKLLGQEALDRLLAFKDLDVEVALAVLGLTRCADNVIGNETLKGISGGERRRVTLGEMLAVGTQILCLDEISNGLDSAATFDICQYLRHVAHIMDQCVVVALLQPPPEVMSLFDDVLVIAEGSIIYHGERAKMMEYFEGLGFRCPPRKELGDFLQELPTKNGAAFALPDQDLRELGIPKPPATPAEFAARWRQSEIFKNEDAQVRLSLSKFNLARESADGFDIDDLPENPWYRQLKLAIVWAWKLKTKDTVKIRAKFIQNLIMGLMFGTLYWQIPMEEAYSKNIMLLQVLMFTAQTAIPEVQTNAQARSIYHKHIDQGFYKGWMLALAQTITSLPLVVADNVVYGQLIYWMTGLTHNIFHYMLFCLVAILFGATMQSVMGVFPYIVQDQNKATALAGMVFTISILLSGVIATSDIIPYYFKPLFHLNPMAWTFRTLANVEYLSPDYDDNPCTVLLNHKLVKVPQRCGDFFLASRQIATGWEYVWAGLGVSVAYLVGFWIITAFAMTYIRFSPARGKKKDQVEADDDDFAGAEIGSLGSNAFELQGPRTSTIATATSTSLRRQHNLVAEEVTLVVHELGYSIKSPSEKNGRLDLLKNITFHAKPGRMLALMGASGAGKTTLLDVLAGIKTVGKARGQIFLNGKPMRHSEFTRLAGYVQQFGTHSPTSTVRESLEFSLALRLPKESLATDQERSNYIEQTLELLELDVIQDQFAAQCSMEQNKRLTLGVELVANPSIVFADEPTTSLDARAAAIVMRVLQKVARSGRVVVATIHQPSVAIFQRFDDLLLLKRGGQMVYFGELGQDSRNMIDYFERIPGVVPCPDGANPAAWMLEVIGGGTGIRRPKRLQNVTEDTVPLRRGSSLLVDDDDDDDDEEGDVEAAGDIDFALIYRNSKLRRLNEDRIRTQFGILAEYFDNTASSLGAVIRDSGYKTSYWTQFNWLLHRNSAELWRSPEFTFSRIMAVVVLTSLYTSIFFQKKLANMADVQSHIMCITFSMGMSAMSGMMTIIPFTINRRPLLYRERGAGMYHSATYNLAAGLSEMPYLFVNAVLSVNIMYFGVGYNPNEFPYVYFFLASFLLTMVLAGVGELMASIMPEPLSAQAASGAFFAITNTFGGIFVSYKRIPKPYLGIHYFSPLRWYYEGVLTTQFYGDDRIICNPLGYPVAKEGIIEKLHLCTLDGTADFSKISGVQMTAEQFVLHDFLEGFEYNRRWIDIAVLFTWIVFLRILCILATAYVSFDKR